MAMEEAIHAIEQLCAMRQGHRGVVTKLVHEADSILCSETVNFEPCSRLSVIKQQLKWKLKLLNDMDSEILDRCAVNMKSKNLNL